MIIALNTIFLLCPTQVEDWWLKVGYLSADTPLVPGTNFGGSWLGPKHPLRPMVGKKIDYVQKIIVNNRFIERQKSGTQEYT